MNTFCYVTGNDNAGFTVVENIFINEYLPHANGDYVRVYLYGLKNSQNPELKPLSTGEIARLLDLTENDVIHAFDYWEEKKLIQIEEKGGNRMISFMNIQAMMHYPNKSSIKPKSNLATDPKFREMIDMIQNMLGGKQLPASYISSFKDWIQNFEFDTETVTLLMEYGQDLTEKKKIKGPNKLKYIQKIAETWHEKGIKTYHDALRYIDSNQEETKFIYQVLSEMRIEGNASPSDRKQIHEWKHTLGFSEEMILEACRRAGKKSFNYINAILSNWKTKGFTTVSDLERDLPPKRTAHDIPEELAKEQTRLVEENADWFDQLIMDELKNEE